MEVVAGGLGGLEGPVVCQDGSIVVTAIDDGMVYRIRDGVVTTLATTGGGANGAVEGSDGTIYIAQNGGARPARNVLRAAAGVQAIAPDGALSQFGEGMTAPNDLAFGPDGKLYVTDPTRKPERDEGRIWRCDVATRQCEIVAEFDWYPNGIGFSADDRWIYLADNRRNRVVRLPLADMTAEPESLAELGEKLPDGFAFDAEGNLLIAVISLGDDAGEVQVFRDGALVETIRPGSSKLYTNLALSGDGALYICDANRGELIRHAWGRPALPLHPFR